MFVENEKDMLEFFKEQPLNDDFKKGMQWIMSRKGWLCNKAEAFKGMSGEHDHLVRFSTSSSLFDPSIWDRGHVFEICIDYDLDDSTWNMFIHFTHILAHDDRQKRLELKGYKDFDSFLKDFQPKVMEWYQERKEAIDKHNKDKEWNI